MKNVIQINTASFVKSMHDKVTCNLNQPLRMVKSVFNKNILKMGFVAALLFLLASSCTKENYNMIYPNGTRFNYAGGSLNDLMQGSSTPSNPFVIDSLS